MVGPVKLTTAAVSTTTTTAVGETAVVSTGLMAHFHTYIYYIFIYHAMADTNKKVISIEMKKKYRPYEKGQHAANHFIKSIWPEEVTAAPLTE